MRFEAFDAEIHLELDGCKPEVPTLITVQHGVENLKWCDFRHTTMLLTMYVRRLVQDSSLKIHPRSSKWRCTK